VTAAEALLEALRARGWRVATAESLTGGLAASALIEVPGASASVAGGVVAYDTAVKHSVLGVDEGLLERHGAVHPEVAEQMARGVRRALRLDGRDLEVGVSTTGIAGPTSPDGQPVGTVYIGVSTPEAARVEHHVFAGARADIRAAAVAAAIALAIDVVSGSAL